MKSINGKVFKQNKRVIALAMATLWLYGLLASGPALALPTGGVVTSGAAAIVQSGSVTNINQSTNKAAINWQTFSIAPAETVNFNQPSIYSITLNRVIGNEASLIQGALNATGRVFLINSNGVLFTKGSSVNTSGFLASTLNITDANFNAGNYVFNANGSLGSIVNQGTITANNGGYVALLGNTVSNQGTISATKGTVVLASGDKMTLNFNGDSLLNVTIDEGTLNSLVENKQAIYADGGTVILTAKAADDLLSAQVNNSGIIQARTIDDLKGHIQLLAQGGAVNLSGTLDASAPHGGDGGLIETSGNKVSIADSAIITTAAPYGKAGTWVIDPDGFTISPQNGDMTGTALSNALNSGNVTIASTSGSGSDGNINVNDTVSWSANTLTLNATKNVYVNAVMTATGTASFAANYGYLLNNGVPTTTPSGTGNADGTPYGLYTLYNGYAQFLGQINFSGTGTVKLNGAPYTVLNSATDLENLYNTTVSGNYVLGSDITDASTYYSAAIGTFNGNFNGFGHRINVRLTGTGFFDTINTGSTVSNLNMIAIVNPDPNNAKTYVGVLANVNDGSILNTFSFGGILYAANTTYPTGSVQYAGGLVGDNAGLIALSYAAIDVYATNIAGGFVGLNQSTGRIINSGVIPGDSGVMSAVLSMNLDPTQSYWIYTYPTTITYLGGFAGVNAGKIQQSYTNGAFGQNDANSTGGGFVGWNKAGGVIDQCYTNMDNTGTTPSFAGFVWQNDGTITNAYATGVAVYSSGMWTAGFAYNNTGTIKNAYVIEQSGNSTIPNRYGFVYNNTGAISNAYWSATTGTGDTVPTDTSTAVSLNATQAATFSSYSGFDPNIWAASTSGFPVLRNIPLYVSNIYSIPTYGTATSDASALGAGAWGFQGGGGSTATVDNFSDIWNPTTSTFSNLFSVKTVNGYVDAGTFNAAAILSSSVYTNIKGVISVSPATLTVAGVVADKTYDGATTATLVTNPVNNGLVGLVGNQTLGITYTSAVFAAPDAGTGVTATVTYTPLTNGTNGGKASNYTIDAGTTTTTGNILPKLLTATFTGTNKTYDGTTTDTVSFVSLNGVVPGDTVYLLFGGPATFSDPNVGTGKTVTFGTGLSGLSASNYTIATTTTTTASITPLVLQLGGVKSYDGTTTVSGSNIFAGNAVAGDTVKFSGSATIASAAIGNEAITSVGGLKVGNSNYTLTGAAGSVAVTSADQVVSQVASGTATFSSSGSTLTVTQTTPSAIIDWLRFSIASGETVNFVQPSAAAIALNRVIGNEQSVINGVLTANGRVFLINSNGILFGAGSSVNVGALLASSLNITDANFLAGNYVFTPGGASAPVINNGSITTSDGGFIALVSSQGVTNSGSLSAPDGKVLLVSADNLLLNPDSADNGLASYVIASPDGTTTLNGVANVAGPLTNGGLIETAGAAITLGDSYQVNTGTNGTWSYSLPAITIGASGNVAASFVQNNLALRNLSLNALGSDLTINDPVTWSANTTLTLAAANNIYINNAITINGATAGLVMNYGGYNGITVTTPAAGTDYYILTPASYAGAVLNSKGIPVANQDTSGGVYGSITFTNTANTNGLTINGQNYTLIHSMSQLDLLDGGNSVTGMYYDPATGKYDIPIGTNIAAFVSNYNSALSFTSNGLFYWNPATQAYDIPQTKVISGTTYYYDLVTGKYDLTSPSWSISRYYWDPATQAYDIPSYNPATSKYYDPSTGTYSLTWYYQGIDYYYNPATGKYDKTDYQTATGLWYNPYNGTYNLSQYGFVTVNNFYYDPFNGKYDSTTLYGPSGCYALAQNLDASGTTYTGALLGSFSGTLAGLGHTISNLTINAPSASNVGLVGDVPTDATPTFRDFGIVNANITGGSSVGILLGFSENTTTMDPTTAYPVTVKNVYTTGTVQGVDDVGGLIGRAYDAVISNTYSSATVTASGSTAGGLLGDAIGAVTITRSDATGSVTGAGMVGGLIGYAGAGNDSFLTINLSYAKGTVTSSGDYAGGLGGFITPFNAGSSISNSFATGNVTSSGSYVGGLLGTVMFGNLNISNSYATGNVTDTGSGAELIGGLVGFLAYASVTDSFATGNVTAPADSSNVGGLIGAVFTALGVTATISNNYATGNVTGGTNVGGLVGGAGQGYPNGLLYIQNSSSYGKVTGVSYVGGILGQDSEGEGYTFLIGDKSYGNVAGTGNYVGGIAGFASSITDSTAYGTVTGTNYVGGIAGGAYIVNDSYYAGNSVTGTGYYVGNQAGNVTTSASGNHDLPDDLRIAAAEAFAAQQQAIWESTVEQIEDQSSFSGQGSYTKGNESQQQVNAFTPVSTGGYQASIDGNIVFSDAGAYSASVKSISADGVQYDLEDSDQGGPNQ